MERTDMAKKLFAQAQKMTLSMSLAVIAYGVIAYYLIHIGKAGPAILDPQIYVLLKYAALVVSAAGIFAMWQVGLKMAGTIQASTPPGERPVQKIFVRTVILCAAAELPVLLGLLLVFFGRQPNDYIPFAVLSAAGFILAFPRKQQWIHWLGIDF
jgi:hypothetical protein